MKKTIFLSLPKDIFFYFREKGRRKEVGREGEREERRERELEGNVSVKEKHPLVASRTPYLLQPRIKPKT